MNEFRDSKTGILSARNVPPALEPEPQRARGLLLPQGLPREVQADVRGDQGRDERILEKAGAKLRIDFREWNDGGKERHFGDLRYSFVTWHQDIDSTRGLLGYGPSSSDPRTGEVISANLNLYNIGLDYYRFLIQEMLEQNGALQKPDRRRSGRRSPAPTVRPSPPLAAQARYRQRPLHRDAPDPGDRRVHRHPGRLHPEAAAESMRRS